MRNGVLLLLLAGLCAAAESPKKYTGTIGDDMCDGDHKAMDGTDPVKCTMDCVHKMHSKYALWVGKSVYVLSDQKSPEQYAGKKVTVTGTLSTEGAGKDKVTTLNVASIKPAR